MLLDVQAEKCRLKGIRNHSLSGFIEFRYLFFAGDLSGARVKGKVAYGSRNVCLWRCRQVAHQALIGRRS